MPLLVEWAAPGVIAGAFPSQEAPPIGLLNSSRTAARSIRMQRGPNRDARNVPSAMRRRIVLADRPVASVSCAIDSRAGNPVGVACSLLLRTGLDINRTMTQ